MLYGAKVMSTLHRKGPVNPQYQHSDCYSALCRQSSAYDKHQHVGFILLKMSIHITLPVISHVFYLFIASITPLCTSKNYIQIV